MVILLAAIKRIKYLACFNCSTLYSNKKTCDIFVLAGIRERRLIDTGSLYLFKFRSTDLSKDGLQQYVVVEI